VVKRVEIKINKKLMQLAALAANNRKAQR